MATGNIGRLFLLQIGSGSPEVFTSVATARSTSMTINNETVDVTAKDTSGARELLECAGITSFTISLAGVFKDVGAGLGSPQGDAQYEDVIRARAEANTIDLYRIIAGNGDTWSGQFQVTSFAFAGEYNGEQTYDITLESSGIIASVQA